MVVDAARRQADRVGDRAACLCIIGALSPQPHNERGDMAASREEVFERVKEVLTEQLGVEESEINEEASFQEDLDADSLDLVELIMELEDQFGIKISDDDAEDHDGRTGSRLRHLAPVSAGGKHSAS